MPPKRKLLECVYCKKVKPMVSQCACGACYKKFVQPRYACHYCEKLLPRQATTAEGDSVCSSCYNKHGLQPKTECSNCKDAKPRYTTTAEGGALCQSCYNKLDLRPKTTCGVCKEDKPRAGTTEEGLAVCKQCYGALELRPTTTCSNCKADGILRNGTTTEGLPVCQTCYKVLALVPKPQCGNCKQNGPVAAYSSFGIAMCHACYNLLGMRPTIDCSQCERKDVRRHGSTADGQPVCASCYSRLELYPKTECSECKQMDRRYGSTVDGMPLCQACYVHPDSECSNCNKLAPRCGTTEDGDGVCYQCYVLLQLQPKWDCSSCKRRTIRAGTAEDGSPLCTKCYRPFPCATDGCRHASATNRDAARHARSHGPWKWRSTMEEWVHGQLIAASFKQEFPQRDPQRGPAPREFWYNSRVFSGLVGDGGGRLECDFMVGLHDERVLWLELHGSHHYEQRLGASPLERTQEHDRRRRVFATRVLPNESEQWNHLEFKEVPCFEFERLFKPWFVNLLLLGESTSRRAEGEKEEEREETPEEDREEAGNAKRQRHIDDYFVCQGADFLHRDTFAQDRLTVLVPWPHKDSLAINATHWIS